jgi:DNA replication protein DnaC
MSRHVETTLTEAAAKNLSASATLEWLADMELEARKQRAIERRYKYARLQAQPSIDAFQFQHHKTRQQAKPRITEPTLLVCDELGYLALDQQTSNLFYQVISTRHSQKRSTIITTNTPFSDWGNILFNTTIATAIADRLVENSEVFLLGGESCASPRIQIRRPRSLSAGPDEAPRCDDNPAGGVRRLTPQRRC